LGRGRGGEKNKKKREYILKRRKSWGSKSTGVRGGGDKKQAKAVSLGGEMVTRKGKRWH